MAEQSQMKLVLGRSARSKFGKPKLFRSSRDGSFCLILVFLTAAANGSPGDTCLDWLAKETSETYSDFDVENDHNPRGRPFSCDSFIRASEALRLIENFRIGFLYDDRERFEEAVRFPLRIRLWNDSGESITERVSIETFDEWLGFKEGHFDRYERALIACATLENLQLFRKWSGFAIGLGRVWFLPNPDGKHKVHEISVKPLAPKLLLRLCANEPPHVSGDGANSGTPGERSEK